MTLHELFVEQLKDLHSAENQLVKALPKMAKAASSQELKTALQNHLDETKGQVERLKQAFESVGEKPKQTLCHGMQGLVEEGQEHIDNDAGDDLGDLALIGAGERVEYYEIAGYTTAISCARALRYSDAADLLTESLKEEQQAAKLLFQIAKPLLKQAGASGKRTRSAGAMSAESVEEDQDEDQDEEA
jgi:ferritin-like metal-binding protein YciE